MLTPALREYVQLEIDFIVETVSATDMQCHHTDGWGPSTNDPKGIEGTQDCLLDRFNLCAKHAVEPKSWEWFDYMACTYRNQKETDTITDHQKAFNATVEYCASVAFADKGAFEKISHCAYGHDGHDLLQDSHATEKAHNKNRDSKGHGHPNWILVNGDESLNSTFWLRDICKHVSNKTVCKDAV